MQHLNQQRAKGVNMAKPIDESIRQVGERRPRSCVDVQNSIDLQRQKCPRCGSYNTKFCYYNNYSLSQPRHFCKNCRRYWTRGGTLRDVPIGGGCRKSKRCKQKQQQLLRSAVDNNIKFISSNSALMHLPTVSAGQPSSSSHNLRVNKCNSSSNGLGMTFSCLWDSVKMHGEQSGADPPSLFNFMPSPNFYSRCPGLDPASMKMEVTSSLPLHEAQNIVPNYGTVSLLMPSSSMETNLERYPSGFSSIPHPVMPSTTFLPRMGEHLPTFNSTVSVTASMDEPHCYQIALGIAHTEEHGEDQDASDIREKISRWSSESSMKGSTLMGEDYHAVEVDHSIFGSLASEESLWTPTWPEMHTDLSGPATIAGALMH